MKWIPVGERMPEEGVEVLICVQYEDMAENGEWDITISGIDLSREIPKIVDYNPGIWGLGSAQNYTVSHWMPLPELPEEG